MGMMKSLGVPSEAPQTSDESSFAVPPAEPTDSVGSYEADISQERKVIRNGYLSLEVGNIRSAADEIGRIAERLGGFVASVNISDTPSFPQDTASVRSSAGSMTVKVPSVRLVDAMKDIRKVAEIVLTESSTSSDVTAQAMDIDAQLKNKRVEETAFTEILQKNVQKVSDILEVTRELARVRGEIERLEAQKTYLASQTDMAELSIDMTESPTVRPDATWRPWQSAKRALNDLLANFRSMIDDLIRFVIVTVPVLLLYALGLWILYAIGKKVYEKMKGSQ
jgi:predicted house-cleaning noncanonical NTP pyrophosphatase (MazG superfamily)